MVPVAPAPGPPPGEGVRLEAGPGPLSSTAAGHQASPHVVGHQAEEDNIQESARSEMGEIDWQHFGNYKVLAKSD